MQPFDFILIALATWRLSHMVTGEAGPYRAFERLRTRYPLGGLTSCIYCLSVWVGWGMVGAWVLDVTVIQWGIIGAAASGAALMLRAYTGAGIHD